MLNINIPDKDHKGYITLFSLTDNKFNKLISTLKEIKIGAKPSEIEDLISSKFKFKDNHVVIPILIKVLFSISNLEEDEISSDTIIQSFFNSYKEIKKGEKIAEKKFTDRFKQILECGKPIKFAYKINDAKLGYGNILLKQNLIVNPKLVFSKNNELIGNVTTTQLHITYKKRGEEESKEIYFALDKKDLETLKAQIENIEQQQKMIEDKLSGLEINSFDL